ncbi:MAG: hypothetical protein JW834_02695 [Candidatus Diapherotrites archaeon]|nr:hypothetical protein [Candidatus Diapherotrites archaeon]
MIPESELIDGTYVLRDMRLTNEVRLTKQSLLRWLALALGLLSPEESRMGFVPVMDAFLSFQLAESRSPTVKDLAERSQQPEKAVRYHMNRLVSTGLVRCDKRRYCFVRDSASDALNLPKAFREHYSDRLVKSASTVESALSELQRAYSSRSNQG